MTGTGLNASAAASGHRPDIDGLRAVAVLPVVLFHAGIPGFSGGFVGVDVFFVISGYLITSILAGQMAGERYSILSFYDRRVRRILPALFVMLAGTTLACLLLMTPVDLRGFAKSLGGTALFASNFVFEAESGYFSNVSDQKPLLHTWSLAVEEQFYIVWPILLALLHRRARALILPVTAVIALVSFALSVWWTARETAHAFYLPHTRGWELLIGALLALRPVTIRAAWLRELASAAGLLLILASVVLFDEATAFPGPMALVPCAGTALCLAANRGGDTVGARLLSLRPMTFIGLISYSLYLWHWPFLALAHYRLMEPPPIPLALALVGLAGVAATLSWRFVERPFRRPSLGRRETVRVVAIAAAASLAVGIVGVGLFVARGLPQRVTDGVLVAERALKDRSAFPALCEPGKARCRAGPPGDEEVVLWGDSHAWALAPGVAEAAGAAGLRFRLISRSACAPLLGVLRLNARGAPDEDCAAGARRAVEALKANESLSTLVIMSRWALVTETEPVGDEGGGRFFLVAGEDRTRSVQASRAAFAAGLDRTVAELRGDLGPQVRIVLVEPTPELGFRAADCYARSRMWKAPETACAGPSSAAVAARQAFARDRLAEVAARYPNVEVLPVLDRLCDADRCATLRDGEVLYFDDDHLNRAGARLVVAPLALTRPGETPPPS